MQVLKSVKFCILNIKQGIATNSYQLRHGSVLILLLLIGSSRFSTKERTKSLIIAIKAVGMAPAQMIYPPLATLIPRDIISPRPPAPMKVPMADMPIATTRAFLIPAIIIDTDRGNCILSKICHLLIPMPLAISIKNLLTFVIAVYVFLIIGKSEYINTVAITVIGPRPKTRSMIDSIAKDGMVCKILANPIIQGAKECFLAMNIPIGIAMMDANSTPYTDIKKCV